MELKLIYEPTIHVVGRQTIDRAEMELFLDGIDSAGWSSDAPADAEELVEIAGRVCYQSFKKPRPGGNSAYLEHILEVMHGSVIEHAVWSFIITGVSRTLTHELVRHRAGMSFSQLSQRYVDSSDIAFVVPPMILQEGGFTEEDDPASDGPIAAAWKQSALDSLQTYVRLAERLETTLLLQMNVVDARDLDREARTALQKQVREAARSVLPNCTETKIFVSANARSLRNALELRGSIHADKEIQRLALKLLDVMRLEAPTLFGDYKVGEQGIETNHRKV